MSVELKKLAQEWYTCDENMIPPEYVLKKLDGLNDQRYWNEVLPKLRSLFRGIRFDKNSSRHLEVGKSVSEWEVKYAVRSIEDSSRTLWIRRQFLDQYDDEAYCDTANDVELHSLKIDLLEWMDVNIGPTRKKPYAGQISHRAMKERGLAFNRYVDQWDDDITALLVKELRKIIKLRTQWESNGCGLGLNGHVAAEFLHHCKIAHNFCLDFAGRDDLLHRCLDIIRQPNKLHKDKRTAMIQAAMTDTNVTPPSNYSAITLAMYGEPGSGKSAFIAKLADELFQHESRGDLIIAQRRRSGDNATPYIVRKPSRISRRPPRPILVRFCGTSENSLHSRSVVRSLRLQIQYLLGPTSTKFSKPPSDWEILNDLLKHHAVIILLDGVNTLEGGFDFLSHLTLHRDTRIIISLSTLPTPEQKPTSPKFMPHNQDLLFALEAFKLDEVACLEIPQPSSEIRAIAEAVLLKKNRTLTSNQWEVFLRQAEVEPSAIYLSLAIKIVEHWQSSDAPQLASSLRGVVGQILDHVEMECGRTLCRLALGLITYSVRGVNDNEMEDMLSLEDDVLESVFQYHVSSVSRIPTHVWTKLRRHMEGLLIERNHGCLTWKHDSLLMIVEARYSQDKLKYYKLLSNYFGNRLPPDIIERKNITKSNLLMDGISVWLKNSRPNYRRCEEAVHGLILLGNLEEAISSLCNFEYLCAAYRCNEGSETIHYLELILKRARMERKNIDTTRVRDYLDWLHRSDSRILEDPQIFIPVTVTLESPSSKARQDYLTYLHVNQSNIEPSSSTFSGDVWIRGLSLGSVEDLKNTSLIRGSVCVSWSPDCTLALTVADDRVRIWDISCANVVSELHDRNHKTVTDAAWNNDGDRILCRSWDGTVIVWNLRQKTVLYTLNKLIEINITAVAWNPCTSTIATGSQDSLLMLWSAIDGSFITTFKKITDYYIVALTWSPDGKDLAILTLSTHIHVYKTETKEEIIYIQHTNQVNGLTWNPGGTLIASGSDDDTVKIWSPAENITRSIFKTHQCAVRAVSWCSDGERIASGDECGKILIWNWFNHHVLASWSGHTDSIHTLIWSPDTTKLASSSKDGNVVVWDSSKETKTKDRKKRPTKRFR